MKRSERRLGCGNYNSSSKRRLRWLGHVLRMEDSRKPHYTVGTNGIQKEAKKNWIDNNIVRRDLKDLDTTWDEDKELATNSRMASTTYGPMHLSGYGMN